MKVDFFFCINLLEKLINLIRASEEQGRMPGPEKRKKVLLLYRDFLSNFPGDQIPAILKNEEFIGSLVDIFVLIANLLFGKRKPTGDRIFLFMRKEDKK
ncbi:MAG: hypothetical protein J7M18_08825 [Candidatus Eremiobacteraeota bacterium]|nr:hypothetical protein [Candidatus Eremiobacteraeota bacterium]